MREMGRLLPETRLAIIARADIRLLYCGADPIHSSISICLDAKVHAPVEVEDTHEQL